MISDKLRELLLEENIHQDNLIYCHGDTENYEQYFKERIPRKMGRNENYQGGSVYKTFKLAKKECPKGYSIYGVKANWDKDTIKSIDVGVNYHDLLRGADLVRLNQKTGKPL